MGNLLATFIGDRHSVDGLRPTSIVAGQPDRGDGEVVTP
jgi:hypothetical protein